MKAEMTNGGKQIVFPNDDVVVPKYVSGITGGRTLDVSAVTESYVKAGHVIITDGKGKYLPLGVSGGKYTAVPESHTICGVLYRTIRKSDPRASIMTSGQVNSVAMPYSIEDVAEAFAKALPLIELVKDEEA